MGDGHDPRSPLSFNAAARIMTELSSCDFCGGGCGDDDCERCYGIPWRANLAACIHAAAVEECRKRIAMQAVLRSDCVGCGCRRYYNDRHRTPQDGLCTPCRRRLTGELQ